MNIYDLQMSEEGDLYLNTDGDIQVSKSLRQAIAIRLRWFYGEFFFLPTTGVQYFEHVFVKKPNEGYIISMISEILLGTPSVASVDSIEIEIGRKTRDATISYTVTADDGHKVSDEVECSNHGDVDFYIDEDTGELVVSGNGFLIQVIQKGLAFEIDENGCLQMTKATYETISGLDFQIVQSSDLQMSNQ